MKEMGIQFSPRFIEQNQEQNINLLKRIIEANGMALPLALHLEDYQTTKTFFQMVIQV